MEGISPSIYLDMNPWVNFYLICGIAKLFIEGKAAQIIDFLKLYYI